MADTGIVDLVKGVFSLSDRYERKARFLPSAFVVLPVSIAVLAVSKSQVGILLSAGLATATEILMIMFMGMVARQLGVRYEQRLFGGVLPTEEWLSQNSPKSQQQVKQWQDALSKLTGLDLTAGDADERSKVIRDATAQARKRLRDNPNSTRTQEYNEDYGFIRNMAGLVSVWIVVSLAGAAACAFVQAWFLVAVELAFTLAGLLYLAVRRSLVRWSAERYAESFLSLVLVVAEDKA